MRSCIITHMESEAMRPVYAKSLYNIEPRIQ